MELKRYIVIRSSARTVKYWPGQPMTSKNTLMSNGSRKITFKNASNQRSMSPYLRPTRRDCVSWLEKMLPCYAHFACSLRELLPTPSRLISMAVAKLHLSHFANHSGLLLRVRKYLPHFGPYFRHSGEVGSRDLVINSPESPEVPSFFLPSIARCLLRD